MDNNSFKDQNGQGYPDLNNVPDNPYSHYYHEYLVDPGEKYVVPISRPRRVSTTVLCIISTLLLAVCAVMWSAVAYTSITDGYIYNFGIDTSLALTIPFAVYFMPGALVTSIIAKALNRKSKWALINIIAACALFVTMLVISLFLPSWGRSINASGSSRDGGISGDWNRDVEELLEEYDFDVTDMDEDYSHLSGDTYEIRIFVSSEASDSDIDEINDFLRDLIELEQKTKYHHMVVRIYPCYFEPGDNSSFVYTKRFRLKEDTSPSDIYIEDSLYDGLKNARRVPGHVPEELENGNLLIVVR